MRRGSARVLALALLLDWAIGEPPNRWHPVVWMGRALTELECRAPRAVAARLAYGLGVATALPVCWAIAAALCQRWLPWPLQAVALKPAFAGRLLLATSSAVETALRSGDVGQARHALRALVSRPTEQLDSSLASAAAIESVAENLVDSWLTPLLAYAVGGLPLAYAYRAVNTADAMWGYRSPHYEHLGKAAARLDDACNWLPARISALLLGLPPHRLLHRLWHEAGRTSSPNAGWPMAAAALALDVRLEKLGHYVLHPAGRAPAPEDIARARRLVGRAMAVSGAVCLALAR